MTYDYLIIGGGIVGAATAWQLQQRFPGKRILLLEQEASFASHQSGHNSGVVHAGVYYEPGSLKARFCREGADATRLFCEQNGLPYERCGKLLVATDERELGRLQALAERCRLNDIAVEHLDAAQLKRLEPNIVGRGALQVRATAITDYVRITQRMIDLFVAAGGEARLRHHVIGIDESPRGVCVSTRHSGTTVTLNGRFLISCAGLWADRTAHLLGLPLDFSIVPFRGEYYRLPPRLNRIVRHLIYPVPDPALPFLGVHLTRMIDGSVTVGPNAVLGWKRDGYGRFNVSLRDSLEMLSFQGLWPLLRKHFSSGLAEVRDSLWKPGYLQRVRRYCPQLRLDDLRPYPAGIRAQAVRRDGTLIHDFLFVSSEHSLHVCNAPSPAATAAIPISTEICDRVAAATG